MFGYNYTSKLSVYF